MKKTYARIYNWKTGESLEIGGTSEQVKKDLTDMRKKGIITDDCSVETYTVSIEDYDQDEIDTMFSRLEREEDDDDE